MDGKNRLERAASLIEPWRETVNGMESATRRLVDLIGGKGMYTALHRVKYTTAMGDLQVPDPRVLDFLTNNTHLDQGALRSILGEVSAVVRHDIWSLTKNVFDPDIDVWNEVGDMKEDIKVYVPSLMNQRVPNPIMLFPHRYETVVDTEHGPRVARFFGAAITGLLMEAGAIISCSTTVPAERMGGMAVGFLGMLYEFDGSPHRAPVSGAHEPFWENLLIRQRDEVATLGEIIDDGINLVVSHDRAIDGRDRAHIADGRDMVRKTLGTLLYLTARNADVERMRYPAPTTKKARRRKPSLAQELSGHAVGYKLGEALRRKGAQGEHPRQYDKGSGRVMPTHWRRPHLHWYNAPNQPGGRVSHFYPGGIINADRADESPVVVRPVTG